MNETAGKDELSAAIERENYPRAAVLGAALGLPEGEIQNLRLKAFKVLPIVKTKNRVV